jgi:hypothetical protein
VDAESLRILKQVIEEGKFFDVYHTRPGCPRTKGFLKPGGLHANFQAEKGGYSWGIGLSSTDTTSIELCNPSKLTDIILLEFDTFVSVNQNF